MINDQRIFSYIDSTEALEAFCAHAIETKAPIAVDTEFMRENTYFPKLSTIQIATSEALALVDVLAKDLDLSPLKPLFMDESITKVFHAARQDLEIFYTLWDAVPTPIADTQIIAMLHGFGDSVGYQSLVKSMMHVELSKDQRVSDWMQRPLTEKQIQYAMGDVIYLLEIHEKLTEKSKERLSWIQDEMDLLTREETYRINPKEAWRRLNIPTPLTPKDFSLIQAISEWREEQATLMDKPRFHILKNPVLWEIVRHRDPEEKIRSLSRQKLLKKSLETSLLKHLKDRNTTPTVPEELLRIPPDISKNALVLDLLKTLHKFVCQKHFIAPKLLCSMDDLKRLIAKDHEDLKLLDGWRHMVFGQDALNFLEGKTSIKIIDGRVSIC